MWAPLIGFISQSSHENLINLIHEFILLLSERSVDCCGSAGTKENYTLHPFTIKVHIIVQSICMDCIYISWDLIRGRTWPIWSDWPNCIPTPVCSAHIYTCFFPDLDRISKHSLLIKLTKCATIFQRADYGAVQGTDWHSVWSPAGRTTQNLNWKKSTNKTNKYQ